MPLITHFKWARGIQIIFERMKFWCGKGGLAGKRKRNETKRKERKRKAPLLLSYFEHFSLARFLPFYMLLHSEMQRQHSRAGTRAHFVNNLWWWRLAASGYSCCLAKLFHNGMGCDCCCSWCIWCSSCCYCFASVRGQLHNLLHNLAVEMD